MENETIILIRDFARILFKNLNERFVSSNVVDSLNIFSIKKIRNLIENELGAYGRDDLNNLIDHFGIEKFYLSTTYKPVIDSETIRNEWRLVKSSIHKSSTEYDESEFWAKFYKDFNEKFPNICKLIMIKSLIPLTTVQCERAFSVLNFIKNDFRSSLGN